MALRALDCLAVEEQDHEVRYLQGALTDEEAEAFEAHYFGCDRCWTALQRAIELRAAFAESARPASASPIPATTAPAPAPAMPLGLAGGAGSTEAGRRASVDRPAPRPWAPRWWPVAAAAVVVLMVGTWRWERSSGEIAGPIDAERGTAPDLRVRPIVGPDSLGVTWSPVHGAEQYRVRLFTTDGTLLVDRQVLDTSVSVGRRSLGRAALPGDTFWSVEAVDATRRSLARSRLTPAVPPPPSR
jgi:hypothetical protein